MKRWMHVISVFFLVAFVMLFVTAAMRLPILRAEMARRGWRQPAAQTPVAG